MYASLKKNQSKKLLIEHLRKPAKSWSCRQVCRQILWILKWRKKIIMATTNLKHCFLILTFVHALVSYCLMIFIVLFNDITENCMYVIHKKGRLGKRTTTVKISAFCLICFVLTKYELNWLILDTFYNLTDIKWFFFNSYLIFY